VPSYRIRSNRKKVRPLWMNSKLQKAVKMKKKEYSRFRKSRRPEDYTKLSTSLPETRPNVN